MSASDGAKVVGGRWKKAANVVAKVDGDGCCASQKASTVAKVDVDGACGASYVAYGCDKSDKIARAAAKAYLTRMYEVNSINGVEGCPGPMANEVLAAVITDIQKQMAGQQTAAVPAANISLGAVSDAPSCAAKAACGSTK